MSLTDDWKAEKLKGWYFILDIHGAIAPDFIYEDTTLKNLARKEVKEVLAPCDYGHIVDLNKMVEQLKIVNISLIKENNGIRHDYIHNLQRGEQNRQLLWGCMSFIYRLPIMTRKSGEREREDLLTRIYKVI